MNVNNIRENWERDHTAFAGMMLLAWVLWFIVHNMLIGMGYSGAAFLVLGVVASTVGGMWVMLQSLSQVD